MSNVFIFELNNATEVFNLDVITNASLHGNGVFIDGKIFTFDKEEDAKKLFLELIEFWGNESN